MKKSLKSKSLTQIYKKKSYYFNFNLYHKLKKPITRDFMIKVHAV